MSFLDEEPLSRRLKDGFSPIGLWWTFAHGGLVFGVSALVIGVIQHSLLSGVVGVGLLLLAVFAFKKFWDLV